MGVEFNLYKDIATITNTAVELVAIDRIVRSHIRNPDFLAEYNALLGEVSSCYQVVIDNVEPFLEGVVEEKFSEQFHPAYSYYINCYLSEISRPREYAERCYEKNLQFKKLKEVNTNYPILKRSFFRLHDIIDKWMDNDIWLAMTIDSLFKLLARLLNEINEIIKKDIEHAFLIYQSGILPMFAYYRILREQLIELPECCVYK